MNMRKSRLARVQLLVATTFTLLFSVAQSDQDRSQYTSVTGDSGIALRHSGQFVNIDRPDSSDDSNSRVALSNANEFGEISIVELRTGDSTRIHFNFRSGITQEVVSATLVVGGELRILADSDVSETANKAAYSLGFDLPSGQILLENDRVSVITPNGFSQISLADDQQPDLGNGDFSAALNDVLRGSDLLGFNMAMAENFAESDLLMMSSAMTQSSKGGDQYTEGVWACAGALTVLTAANATLAAAIAATYATVGAAALAIAGAVSLIGGAMAMVDMYCLQM